MTDEQFNLYINLRREYKRTNLDLAAFTDERSQLDNLFRIGSQPPLPSDYRWWERLLMRLRLRRPRLTLIPSDRLQKYEDRLKYLDEVVSRCDRARLGISERLRDFNPSVNELRFVDTCDRIDAMQSEIDRLKRLCYTK
jgi:uncharacterized small protein (DUF1192 family)